MTERVDFDTGRLFIRTTRPDKLLRLPHKRWSKPDDAFVTPATLLNCSIVAELFASDVWTPAARAHLASLSTVSEARDRNEVLTRARDKIDLSVLDGREWGKYPPYLHQKQAIALAGSLPEFAFFMDQGTGKTLCLINHAAEQWRQDKIELVVVICPNNVKTNWRHPQPGGVCELETHRPADVPFVSHVWISPQSRDNKLQQQMFERSLQARKPALHWFVINVEALSSPKVQEMLHQMVEGHKTLIAVDESTRIKTPGAARTKVALSLARYAEQRVIMSGTPVIKAPEHAWAQLRFLGPDAMPFESVTAFKKKFVIESRPNGFKGQAKVEGYRDLDELSRLIDRVSFRVMKEECLDLPPKIYNRRNVEFIQEQEHAYEEMRKRSYVFLEKAGLEVAATIILVQMLRLQQIACGFLPRVDYETGKLIEVVPIGDPNKNPKICSAIEELDDIPGKVIIWCAFTPQLQLMSQQLEKAGHKHVLFYGATSDEERVKNREQFQNDPATKVFLGNPAAGGIGLTLTAAEAAFYMSNSFKTEERVQSEDRCHRIGSDIHSVINYYDFVTEGSIDEKIIGVLRANKRLSDEIMRTGWKSWI